MRGVLVLLLVGLFPASAQAAGVEEGGGSDGGLGKVRLQVPEDGPAGRPVPQSDANPILDEILDDPCGAVVDACPPPPGCLLAPPTLLRAERTLEGVLLTWESPVAGDWSAFVVHRAVEYGSDVVAATTRPLDRVAGTQTSYLDGTAQPGAAYLYWVVAAAPDGCRSAPSAPASVPAAAGGSTDLADCAYVEVGSTTPVQSATVAGDCLSPHVFSCTPFRSYWTPSNPLSPDVDLQVAECARTFLQ